MTQSNDGALIALGIGVVLGFIIRAFLGGSGLGGKDLKKISNSMASISKKFYEVSTNLILENLTIRNKESSIRKLQGVVDFLKKNMVTVQNADFSAIEKRYQELLKEEEAENEQARLREQMRDEAKAERDRAREISRLEKEKKDIERQLTEQRLKKQSSEQAAIIKRLQEELASNAERTGRIKSMAVLTKYGRIYVISNIGSFGEKYFKVGMTRRLVAEERIDELGDASVPFPFDIHMLIQTHDAPALERVIHDKLQRHRVNLVNPRKEFFAVSLETISKIIDEHKKIIDLEVEAFIPHPVAHQYRESLKLKSEIEQTGDKASQTLKERLFSRSSYFSKRAKNDPNPAPSATVTKPLESSPNLEKPFQSAEAPASPPSEPSELSILYYLTDSNQTYGPYPEKQIIDLLESGAISKDWLIAKEGDSEWKKLSDLLIAC